MNAQERYPPIRSVERTLYGFKVHGADNSWSLFVHQRNRRLTEAGFRAAGLVIVDQWGSQIDDSQFAKERDDSFNRTVGPGFWAFWRVALTPNWVLARRYRRDVRQSSDDA